MLFSVAFFFAVERSLSLTGGQPHLLGTKQAIYADCVLGREETNRENPSPWLLTCEFIFLVVVSSILEEPDDLIQI